MGNLAEKEIQTVVDRIEAEDGSVVNNYDENNDNQDFSQEDDESDGGAVSLSGSGGISYRRDRDERCVNIHI